MCVPEGLPVEVFIEAALPSVLPEIRTALLQARHPHCAYLRTDPSTDLL
jgi:hypothetical protein